MAELVILMTAHHRPSFRRKWINAPTDGRVYPPPFCVFSLSFCCLQINFKSIPREMESWRECSVPFPLPPLSLPPPRQTNHTRKKVKKKAAGWNPKNGRRPANWISTPLAPEYYPTGDLICPTWFQLRFVSSIWHLGAAARHQLLINSTRNQSRPR